MDSSPQQSFQERLSQWVASQGFWFQLRYATAAGGGLGAVGVRFLSLSLRVFLLIALVAAGGWIYLVKRTSSPKFPAQLAEGIEQSFHGAGAKVDGFTREGGQGYIHNLKMKGTDASFFDELEAREVHFKMDVLDGVRGQWNLGPLRIKSADLLVKAGGDSDKEASTAIESLFQSYPNHAFGTLEIESANLGWGYSDRTRGSIRESRMLASKVDENTWKIDFTGGKFSQNWIQNWAIEKISIVCTREGLEISQVALREYDPLTQRAGRGRIDGKLNILAGAKPQWDGTINLDAIPLDKCLSMAFGGLLEGSISGQLKIAGSTNSQEGLSYRGDLLIDKDDQVVLRDRVPLLRALSVVDAFNSYKRVSYSSGSCSLSYGAGEVNITKIDFSAGDLMTLRGNVLMRPPTEKEVEESMSKTGGNRANAQTFLSSVEEEQQKLNQAQGNRDISLKQAATSKATTSEDRAFSIFDQQNVGGASANPAPQNAREKAARMPRYDGLLSLSLPTDVFQRAPELQRQHPVDPSTQRVTLDVPLKGGLFELTLEQAEHLYEVGKPKL